MTIREVADRAGVSVATVSRVFAGLTTVSPELVTRVRRAAVELDYRPNVIAQGLARGRVDAVGVLVPNLANPYFNDVVKGLMHAAERDDYRVVVADSDENTGNEPILAESLLRWSEGVILVAPRGRAELIKRIASQGKPVVAIDRRIKGMEIVSVNVDSFSAMEILGKHLSELGHRRVVYLRGPLNSWQSRQRWAGLRSLRERGVSVSAVACGGTIEEGYASADEALRREATAVMAFNDLTALGFMARCAERGVSIPEDVSVTGFDDIPFVRFTMPALTSVCAPLSELGASAWQAMRHLLRGERVARTVTLSSEVVIRASTAPPRART